MSNVQIPDGWRQYKPGEVRAIGDRFCHPLDQLDYSRTENWYTIQTHKNDEEPLVPEFVYIKPIEKTFDEKFLESLRKFASQLDAMIADIKERIK